MTGLHDSLRYVVVIFVNDALYFCPNEHATTTNDRPARSTALWCMLPYIFALTSMSLRDCPLL